MAKDHQISCIQVQLTIHLRLLIKNSEFTLCPQSEFKQYVYTVICGPSPSLKLFRSFGGLKKLGFRFSYSNLKLSVVAWCVIFAISSLNIGRYGYLDDYSNLWNAKHNAIEILKLCFSQGRPILGLITLFVFLPLSTIDHLFFIHLCSSFCLASLGLIVYKTLVFANDKSKRFDQFTIFWLSVLPLLVTSGFLILGAWSTSFPALLGLTFGCFGVLKIVKEPKSKTGSLLVALNVLIYQPNFILMTLIFLTAQIILNSNSGTFQSNKNWRSYKLVVCLISANAIIGLACIQFAKIYQYSSGARSAITTEYSEKFAWFVDSLLPRVIFFYSPWQPNNSSLVLLIALSIAGGIFLYLGAESKKKFFLIVLAILPISVAPNILISENWASSRSLLAPQWFFSFLVFVPVLLFLNRFLVNTMLKMTASVCIVAAVTFNFYQINVVNFKRPQEIELKIARQYLTEEKCKNLISATQSTWTDSLARKVSYDEYGIPSTAQPWVPIPLTKLICYEKGIQVKTLVLIPLEDSTSAEGNVNFAKLIQTYKDAHD